MSRTLADARGGWRGRTSSGVERPLFIIGTGRSGTTLFFDLLTQHPDLAWLPNYAAYLPRQHWVALAARVYDLPILDRLVDRRWRFVPKPAETYEVLDYCSGGVFRSPHPIGETDVTPAARERFHRVFLDYLRLQRKARFALKHTGFGRVRYLQEIFRDALFIHVYRDGRAVANSLMRVPWWRGDLDDWHWGEMKPEYRAEYETSGGERVVLAGIVWKTLMDLIEEECAILPAERLLRMRYDSLVAAVREGMETTLRFCDLPSVPTFWRRLQRHRVADMDTKWTRDLSRREQSLLDEVIGSHLARYGFKG